MILTVSSQKYRVSRSLFSWSGTECSHSEREKVQLGKQSDEYTAFSVQHII